MCAGSSQLSGHAGGAAFGGGADRTDPAGGGGALGSLPGVFFSHARSPVQNHSRSVWLSVLTCENVRVVPLVLRRSPAGTEEHWPWTSGI